MQHADIMRMRAKRLRQRSTQAERELWSVLRAWCLNGVKFTRQVSIGPYIADFAARSLKLIVEIDGASHEGREDYDARRDAWLSAQGYRVLRFSEDAVLKQIERVVLDINQAAKEQGSLRSPPSPRPSPWQGEGDHEPLLSCDTNRSNR